MVLAHTAGIPDYEDSAEFATQRLDPDWDPTPQDVIGFARALPPHFSRVPTIITPTRTMRSLDSLSKRPRANSYADELASRFFGPLGLTHTHFDGYQEGDSPEMSYFLWCSGVPTPLPSSSPTEKLASKAACIVSHPLHWFSASRYTSGCEREPLVLPKFRAFGFRAGEVR
jgi:CubicO group peptidase (beta-lactamase class C family)